MNFVFSVAAILDYLKSSADFIFVFFVYLFLFLFYYFLGGHGILGGKQISRILGLDECFHVVYWS